MARKQPSGAVVRHRYNTFLRTEMRERAVTMTALYFGRSREEIIQIVESCHPPVQAKKRAAQLEKEKNIKPQSWLSNLGI